MWESRLTLFNTYLYQCPWSVTMKRLIKIFDASRINSRPIVKGTLFVIYAGNLQLICLILKTLTSFVCESLQQSNLEVLFYIQKHPEALHFL